MALDDLIASQLGTISGFLGATFQNWIGVANAARSPNFKMETLFEATRKQWVANWDFMNGLSAFPGSPVMPTVAITGPYAGLVNLRGRAFVGQQLVGLTRADFTGSDLEQFGGANVIAGAFEAEPAGDFNGQVRVKILKNAPAVGIYRGLVFAKLPNAAARVPLAWVVVDAT